MILLLLVQGPHFGNNFSRRTTTRSGISAIEMGMVRFFGGGVGDLNGLKDQGCLGGARVQKPLKGKGV